LIDERIDMGFVMRVLRVFALFPNDIGSDAVMWRMDGKYAPITFFVVCSDEFHRSTADAEQITPENIAILEQAVEDARRADDEVGVVYAPLLFCARVRKCRPLRTAYPDAPELVDMLDACGP
jgi:hypothetical protein